MIKPLILVTGATGKTGRATVAELIRQQARVRALVHRRDERSAAIEALGADIVVADMFDPDQLADALRGVQRAYYLPFFHTHVIQSAVAFALAARAARLEQIVHMGQWLSHRAHPAILTRQTWLIDQLFADLPGIAHTTLNPGMFADNFLRVIDFAALLGIFPVLTGDGKAAPVSNEDLARCAAAVLLAPERYAGMSLRPTGPALLSAQDMARVIAKVVGHKVLPVKLPWFLFSKVARQQRVNPLEISGLRHYIEDMKRGAFELDGGLTSVVADLTGQPAEDFETIARRYAAMPFARVTLGRRLRAFASFNMVPFLPGYDLDRWERQVGLPVPPNPSFSIDDARWRAEHHEMMTRPARPRPALVQRGAA